MANDLPQPGCAEHRTFNLLGCPDCDKKHQERLRRDRESAAPGAALYYVQDKRSIVGNSILWWRKGGHGYACNLQEAEVFTQDQARDLIERSGHKYRAWPKAYIDARISHHVDFQYCETSKSLEVKRDGD